MAVAAAFRDSGFPNNPQRSVFAQPTTVLSKALYARTFASSSYAKRGDFVLQLRKWKPSPLLLLNFGLTLATVSCRKKICVLCEASLFLRLRLSSKVCVLGFIVYRQRENFRCANSKYRYHCTRSEYDSSSLHLAAAMPGAMLENWWPETWNKRKGGG